MKPERDPKLTEVAAQITAILKAADMAGMVLLFSPPCSELHKNLLPSWSCLGCGENSEVIFKSRREDYASIEEFQRCRKNTLSMLSSFHDLAGKVQEDCQAILEYTGIDFTVQHFEDR